MVVAEQFNADKGQSVASEVKGHFVRTDVADEASCNQLAATAVDKFGRIDILVNNAAMFSTLAMRPFWEIPAAEWDQLMAVNVRGVWLASKAVVPQMRKQRSGRIVNISSAVIWMGRPNYLHYVASKGAVLTMTRAMAKELGEFGINVNAITPGAVYTEVPRGDQRLLLLRRDSGARHLGVYRAGRDGVDVDAELAELLRHRARHRQHRALARDVVQVVRAAHPDDRRGDVDDAPAALLPHLRHDRLRSEPHAAHVDRHELVPLRRRNLPEGPHRQRREHGRVVDEDVDAAEFVHRRRRELVAARFIRDVGAHEMAFHLGRHRLAFVGIELRDHHLRAFLRQAMRVGAAETLARAGDDRDFVLEPHNAAVFACCFTRRGP